MSVLPHAPQSIKCVTPRDQARIAFQPLHLEFRIGEPRSLDERVVREGFQAHRQIRFDKVCVDFYSNNSTTAGIVGRSQAVRQRVLIP